MPEEWDGRPSSRRVLYTATRAIVEKLLVARRELELDRRPRSIGPSTTRRSWEMTGPSHRSEAAEKRSSSTIWNEGDDN